MTQLESYILLIAIIGLIGTVSRKSTVPLPLLLVIAGMVLSFFPDFPKITLNPELVLNFFLPIIVYEASAFFSWHDIKKNIRPILLLSIGHVIFITVLVAITIHYLIPKLGWPLSFVLGAVIAPPDDVAIISIADKIKMPARPRTILMAEGILNDATALILFRFSLVVALTNQFSLLNSVIDFSLVIVGETLYGLLVGFLMGNLRLYIADPILQMMFSILTPFLAYFPAVYFGGCGVLATVITGLVIGNKYLEKYPPDVRLTGRAVWTTASFTLQSILFLLVGLNFPFILKNIAGVTTELVICSVAVVAVVIIGRFLWVFPAAYLPRLLSKRIAKEDPSPPWQYPFIISWAGMRGGVSLAAAFAVPFLPSTFEGANTRYFIIFLVFCVVTATLLLQGLTLPTLMRWIGVRSYQEKENYEEHLAELSAKLKMVKGVLEWLANFEEQVEDDKKLCDSIKLLSHEYKILKKQLKDSIKDHDEFEPHDGKFDFKEIIDITTHAIEIERTILLQLWRKDKVTQNIKNKLMTQLDHRTKHFLG